MKQVIVRFSFCKKPFCMKPEMPSTNRGAPSTLPKGTAPLIETLRYLSMDDSITASLKMFMFRSALRSIYTHKIVHKTIIKTQFHFMGIIAFDRLRNYDFFDPSDV